MTTPKLCATCGHELGIGRFCTNCGQPVPGRHPEAPTAPGAPAPPTEMAPGSVEPPPSGPVPPAPRYPLFADGPTADSAGPSTPPPPYVPPAAVTQVSHPQPGQPPPSYGAGPPPPQRSGKAWLPWLAAAVVLVVVAGAGIFLLVGSGDDDSDRGADDTRNEQRTDEASDSGPSEDPSTEPAEPDSTGSGAPIPAPDPADVVDLAGSTRADVPAVAPPGRDTNNKPVRYGPGNLFDAKPRTAWRMPGDGAGTTLTFTLDRSVVLTEVGLINGYAKIDGPDNWYQANRRIRAVQWEFDDGTRVTQTLTEKRSLQALSIDPVETSRVRLHLLAVSQPATGDKGRNYTAISEISLRGAPA